MNSARFSLFFLSSLAVAACGGGGSSSSTGSSGDATSGSGSGGGGQGGGSNASASLPCEVSDVLTDRCQSCHSDPPKFGAPMPLVTRADLMAPANSDPKRPVYELVGERIHDSKNPMPQPPNKALDAEELKTLDSWIAAGAPSSSVACEGEGGEGGAGGGGGGATSLSCKPDIHLEAAKPWAMPKDVEDVYVCYGVDVTPAQKSQLVGFAPRVDNETIVHHILLFQTDKSVSSTPKACSLGGAAGWKIVAVWAPGGEPVELPPEVGLPIDETAHFVVQTHYSNLMHLDGQTDNSGYDLCSTTDLRPNEGDILAFGTTKISIPAAGSLDVTCDFKIPAGSPDRKVVGGMPHMHKLGRTISTVDLPGGSGAPVDLGTRDPWSFDSQYWTTLSATIKAGDTIRTRCAWDNPSAKTVTFGEDTSDEMCYSFAIYYPRITTPGWAWALPAASSKCSKTP